jgi:hypothetical protein
MLGPKPVNPPLLRSRDAGLAHARQHTEATEYGPARHLFDAGSGADRTHGAPAAAAETAVPGARRPEIAEVAALAGAPKTLA